MAYDRGLAERIRAVVAGRRGVTEKAMFGGLAYLLDGKMFCGVLGDELLARVGPDAHDVAMARAHVRVMDFTGRPMRGYVFVGPRALASRAELGIWVDACATHVATLPVKKKPRGTAARRPATKGRAAAKTSTARKPAASRRPAATKARRR